jgi:hypothetical protein
MSEGLRFDHLERLSTPLGLYEHALGTTARIEHGFCVDDVARALVVTSREPAASTEVRGLSDTYLAFLLAAQHDDGLMHNRRDADGAWTDTATSDDHWGRALWALGTAAAHLADPVQAARARHGAARAMRARSRWPRAMAYAAVGAGQLLHANPDDGAAVQLLADARRVLGRVRAETSWPWPETRLTYANAVLPEAMIVIGDHLDDTDLRAGGLSLLRWLVDEQTVDGRLSLVPSGGRSRADSRPGYAQQPIEAAVLAEACRTAYEATSDDRWTTVIAQCVAWFEGANDGAVVMCDASSGGGYDGLEAHGASQNQGAESTLAWLSTLQVSRVPRVAAAR